MPTIVLIRVFKSIQISLAVSILLVSHYLYFGNLPQSTHINLHIVVAIFLLIPFLYLSIGHWEGVLLALLGIGFNALYLEKSSSELEPMVLAIRLLLVGMQIDFFIGYTKLAFRTSLLSRLPGLSPHMATILCGTLIAGCLGYGVLEFVPKSGLVGHDKSIAWFISSLVVYSISIPFISEGLVHRRVQKTGYSYTIRMILRTLMVYFLFITGCLLLTALGFVLFVLLSRLKNTAKRKLFFHKTIQTFCKILILAATRRVRIIGESKKAFKSPAVLIANHQSFIDLIVIQSLHHKIVLLTNDWVWNSPLFGMVARWADYYPVSSGIENSLGKLQEIVNQGYSIAVFPEGSRSKDMRIKRFKKGAFYLAEKLNLDILPIILHGTGEGIAKKEFVFKKTSLTVLILPKIEPENPLSALGYSERSKQISEMFKNEYNSLQQKCETPEFLTQRLLLAYAYQGYSPLQAIRRMIKYDKEFVSFLFSKSFHKGIVHFGSNYGELTFLLHQKYPDLMTTGLEKDKAKREVARCVSESARSKNVWFRRFQTPPSIEHECDLYLINLDRIGSDKESIQSLIVSQNKRLVIGGTMILYKEKCIHSAPVDSYASMLDQVVYKKIASSRIEACAFTKQHEAI